MKEEFDIDQGHGDHIDTVNGFDSSADFLARLLPEAIQKADMALKSEGPVECELDAEKSRLPIVLLGDRKGPIRLLALIAVNEAKEKSELLSFYPECDGVSVEVRLTAVHEWASGVEATLEGTVLGEAERNVAFFDTRYALNKERYKIGDTYVFKMSAFAYGVEIVSEKDREIRFEGESAVEHRRRFGEEPEYEEDGSVKPVVISMAEMVAFFQNSVAYPDDGEFQSPVFSDAEEFSKFDADFYKLEVAIARDEEDVRIPLIVQRKLFERKPLKAEPVRGRIWVQGHLGKEDDRVNHCKKLK